MVLLLCFVILGVHVPKMRNPSALGQAEASTGSYYYYLIRAPTSFLVWARNLLS